MGAFHPAVVDSHLRPGRQQQAGAIALLLDVKCLMKDYKAVLQAVLDVLPGPPAVVEIVMDFERAVWFYLMSIARAAHSNGGKPF